MFFVFLFFVFFVFKSNDVAIIALAGFALFSPASAAQKDLNVFTLHPAGSYVVRQSEGTWRLEPHFSATRYLFFYVHRAR